MVNIIDFGWHQTIITLLFVIVSYHFHHVYGTAAVAVATAATSNQHQIIENPKFLSHNNANANVLQPSRLRTLLINDLRNSLVKNVCINSYIKLV